MLECVAGVESKNFFCYSSYYICIYICTYMYSFFGGGVFCYSVFVLFLCFLGGGGGGGGACLLAIVRGASGA